MKQYNVTIDFGSICLSIEANNPEEAEEKIFEHYNIWEHTDENKVTIVAVDEVD